MYEKQTLTVQQDAYSKCVWSRNVQSFNHLIS